MMGSLNGGEAIMRSI